MFLFRAALACRLLLLWLCTAPGALWAAPLTLTEPVTLADGLIGHVTSLRDPEGRLTPREAAERATTPVVSRAADFGYTTDKIWLRIDIVNGTEGDTAITDWRVRYRENFFQEFAVYKLDPDGTLTVLENLVETSNFAARDVAFAELAAAFTLEPGASTTILTRYRSGGSSDLSFSFLSAKAFESFTASMTARNFVFYGMMLFLILAALVLFAVQAQWVFAAYAGYIGSALMFIMHADGNSFRFLWPEAPLFNGFASAIWGTALIFFGANFVRLYLQTSIFHPRLEMLLRATIAVGLAVFASALFVDHQWVKKVLVLGAFLSTLLYTFAGFVAARTRFREVRFYLLAWTGALISSGIMTSRHWLGWGFSEELQFNSMRIVIVIDSAMMGFAVIDRINQLKRAQRQVLERSLAETRRNLLLSQRLQVLERRYELAQDLARTKSQQVADTLHDLRGPLHALRLNLQSAGAREGPDEPESTREMEQTFAYLEALVGQELTRHTSLDTSEAPRPAGNEASEASEIGTVLKAVTDMFAGEAEAKGLSLRAMPTSASTALPPFALMRIASNLLSNAVKYTQSGRVLMGVRHGGPGGLRLEIHDTGPGLGAQAFTQAGARSERLGREDDEGHGLGLSIVADLAREHGLTVGLVPGRRGGTGVFVTLPPAR